MTFLLLLSSIVALTLSHICKARRWQLFVSIYENIPDTRLINSLASGYLLNFYLPFHMGDLLRAWLAGRKMQNGVGYSLATVIVDRVLDVLSVACIFLGMALISDSQEMIRAAQTYVVILIALAVLCAAMFLLNRQIKQAALSVCSIFNDHIKFRLLFFLWSLISSFKDIFRKVHKKKLFFYTVAMWGGYAASYALIARTISSTGSPISFSEIFLLMFRTESIFQSTFATTSGLFCITTMALLCVYVLAPLPLLMIVASCFSAQKGSAPACKSPLMLLPQLKPEEQLHFLQNYFEARERRFFQEYLSMNNDVGILRDYSAGSDATTMLCIREDQTVFRKYAFGNAVDKLVEQAEWIKKHYHRLPLPEIVREKQGDNSYYYDMRYADEGISMFQYIYSHPIRKSWQILNQVLTDLRSNLHAAHRSTIDPDALDDYITTKVEGNLRQICQSRTLRALTEPDTIVINGVTCKNLPQLRFMLEREHLRRVFAEDISTDVHGDLTLENIICYASDDHDCPYYLIDPNPGNPVCTPNLDYGKLLQSLHGNYEFLGQQRAAHVSGNSIDFLLPDSSQYRQIYQLLQEWMMENLTKAEIRSVYYHEIIHWLRLMPYRLRRSEATANQYYAAMILVMNDVYTLFEETP